MTPHNQDAEGAVLSAFLQSNETYLRHAHLLREGYFHLQGNKAIAEAIATLHEKSHTVSPATVTSMLRQMGKMEEAGGSGYINSLAAGRDETRSVATLIDFLEEAHVRREALKVGEQMGESLASGVGDPRETVEKAEAELAALRIGGKEKEPVAVGDLGFGLLAALEDRMKNKGVPPGIPTGLKELDALTGGYEKGRFYIIAARPAMGKTACALSQMLHAALALQKPVLLFSLEMSAEQIGMRALSIISGIEADKLKKGTLSQEEFDHLMAASELLRRCRLYIDDTPAITLAEMSAKARRYVRDKGVEEAWVDYIQLMGSPKAKGSFSRDQEISKLAEGLKKLAKQLVLPVIALAQVSRSVESRSDKRPMLSDLRESGSLEQAADCVMFLFRPEYYGNSTDDGASNVDLCEVIVAKQRDGGTGTANVRFDKKRAAFRNWDDGFDTYMRYTPRDPEEPMWAFSQPPVEDPLVDENGIPF